MPDSNISPPKPSGYSIPAFLLGAVLSALLAYSTPTNAAERKPNFLVIVSDDQRPDTIRAVGNKHISTVLCARG